MSEPELAIAVKKAFVYSADGKLLWQIPPTKQPRLKGSVAGSPSSTGYINIGFMGKRYKRHRLIFLYHHGRFPRPMCDHINRDRSDDRIENLRELTAIENTRNHSRISVRVSRGGRFTARLVNKTIGTFDTFEEAKQAYIIERKKSWSQ